MESAPLTLAYDHAKAASIATQTSDTTVALTEHAHAAGEFAKAAHTTCSHEALRTLKLLETHHQRLSALLKFPAEHPIPPADAELATTSEKPVPPSPAVTELRTASPRRTPTASTTHAPRRMPPREMSSSIASNLASARGIRTPTGRRALSPGVTLAQAPGSLEPPRRAPAAAAGKPSWLPPITHEQIARAADARAAAPPAPPASAAEDGFQRFYATFEGLLSKLSAPLAFAGLPLLADDPDTNRKATPAAAAAPAPAEPDLSKYISRAALRASATSPNPANDSFYVVPATGHTATYATILSFAEKEQRRQASAAAAADSFDGDDAFEDAREHQVPPPLPSPSPSQLQSLVRGRAKPIPGKSGAAAGKGQGKGGQHLENVCEELYLENRSLKTCVDHLSRRLAAFEAAAQSSTRALQESIRMCRPASPASAPASALPASAGTSAKVVAETKPEGEKGNAKDDAADDTRVLAARVRALEDALEAEAAERRRVAGENERLKVVVGRYRERWERLKEGAKTRREKEGREGGAAAGAGEAGGGGGGGEGASRVLAG